VHPFITAAAEITALRMMNFRRSRPAGISFGTGVEGSSGSRLSSLTSSFLAMALLCAPFRLFQFLDSRCGNCLPGTEQGVGQKS
jgi:hypothetical protein